MVEKEKSSAEQSFKLVKVLREIRNLMEIMLYVLSLNISYCRTGDTMYSIAIFVVLLTYSAFRLKQSGD